MFDHLTFATFKEIESKLFEITVHEGVEVSPENIQHVEECILEKSYTSYALLINRKNKYSFNHETLKRIVIQDHLTGYAILVFNDLSRYVAEVHSVFQDNSHIFDEREEAIDRLRGTLKNTPS